MRGFIPETLFGRLLSAVVAVVAATLLVIVLLVLHERRELAFAESGSRAAASTIAQTSIYLASLRHEQRKAALTELRSRPMAHEHAFRGPPPPEHRNVAALHAFVEEVRKTLGDNYKVTAGPPRAHGHWVIDLQRDRGGPGEAPPGEPPPPGEHEHGHEPPPSGQGAPHQPPGRMFDLTVTLPDGERVVFRAATPRGPPPFPTQLFIELAVLTLVLGAVLYAMTRSITKPLDELALAADAVGRGSRAAPLKERGARELKRATHAFNAMQERLNRYLDSRTRVLAAMSHDLRTPLTRLRLRVESIEDEALRQRCEDDLEEMTKMVTGALSLFRGLNDDEPAVPIDVNALAIELQKQFGEIGGDVQVKGRALSEFVGKPLAIKRCLSNLIDNALRYGGRATLAVEDGPALVIRILDEGPGIPAESLDRVFEPFFRLESSRNRNTGGTGLGLSIARDVAQAHGGSLTLANRAEGGVDATLTLPRSGADSFSSPPPRA
jgi:signal transduction histidine kinase